MGCPEDPGKVAEQQFPKVAKSTWNKHKIYTAKWMLRGIPQFQWDCGISMQWDHGFSEFTVPFHRPTTLWVSCISLSEISVPMWETAKCHAAASHVLNTPYP